MATSPDRRSSLSSSSSASFVERGIQGIGLEDVASKEMNDCESSDSVANENMTPPFASVLGQATSRDLPSSPTPDWLPLIDPQQQPLPSKAMSNAVFDETNSSEEIGASQPPSADAVALLRYSEPDRESAEHGKGSFRCHRQLPTKNSVRQNSLPNDPPTKDQLLEESKPQAISVAKDDPFSSVSPIVTISAMNGADRASVGNDRSHDEGNEADEGPVGASSLKKKRRNKSPSSSQEDGISSGRWTDAEHQVFMQGLQLYGREWKKVASLIPTRTSAQVRSHAQKYFTKLQREQDSFLALSTSPTQSAQSSPQGLLPYSEAADLQQQRSSVIDGISPAVQSSVARILANPETVEAEVEETLHQLRERYSQLQRRLQQTDQEAHDRKSSVVPPDPLQQDGKGRKRTADHNVVVSCGSATASLASSHNTSILQDEELIALSVLQGGLPRMGCGSSLGGSSANDTASEMENTGNNTNYSTNHAEGEEGHDDDDGTLTDSSDSSNKRSKLADCSSP